MSQTSELELWAPHSHYSSTRVKSEVNNLKAEVKEMKGKTNLARECTYCGKTGHTEKFCHKKIADEQHANQL